MSVRTSWTMRGAAIGMAAGGIMGGGFMAIESAAYGPTISPAEAEADLANAQSELVGALDAQAKTHLLIGETCLTALRPYFGEGVLAGVTDEAIVVSDILAEPNQPCGETPREVRLNFYHLDEANSDVDSAETYVDYASRRLEEVEDSPTPGTTKDVAILAMTAGIFGAGVGNRIGRNEKERRESAPSGLY